MDGEAELLEYLYEKISENTRLSVGAFARSAVLVVILCRDKIMDNEEVLHDRNARREQLH